MLEWLREHPGSDPFLIIGEHTWTYAETVSEVESRLVDEMVLVRPQLDAGSVFALMAGISGSGVVVLPPDPSTKYQVPSTDQVSGADLVAFTSGTTGAPKGVRLTAANLEAASRASVEHPGHGRSDCWLLAMPLHHVGGISILVRSAYAGGSVHLLPSFDPLSVAMAIRGGVTMLSVVPTMLSRLLDHDPGPYPNLRAVLVGGGPIPAGLLEMAAGMPVLPTYGMTETFGQVATLRPGSSVERKAHPLPGVELEIRPDGRIAVAGDQVSPGYLGEPDRADRWLVTNDLGSIDPDGALRVLGRADSVIVSGGENISPERVESELHGHPTVGDVVVFGVPDEEWGSLLCCLYTGSAGVDEMVVWLKDRLPSHMVPKLWKRVDSIPLIGPGKPDRNRAAGLIGG